MQLALQIASAVLVVIMLVYLWPAAKHWMTNGPRAQPGDWQAALVPLLLVAGFVLLLVWLARSQ
jgi:uncharacterized membrane protein YphA (DoxX/SURF4 family)